MAYRNENPVDISMASVNGLRSRKLDPVHRRPLHDYVPLYFNPKNPMVYARKRLCGELAVLALDRALLPEEGVVFTEGNAAAFKSAFFSGVHDLEEIDWGFMPIEIYRHDPAVSDDLFVEFRTRLLSRDRDELARIIGLRKDVVDKLRGAVERSDIATVGQLIRVKGIGPGSLEKTFRFLVGSDDRPESGQRALVLPK